MMNSKSVLIYGIFILLTGCITYHPKPLSPEKTAEIFQQRRLTDPVLQKWMGGPVSEWDLDHLTLAAFYYQPDLEVARAHWRGAQAGQQTAAERPNPTFSVDPTWVSNPDAGMTPWILGFALDIPIETAGKRGILKRQASAQAEAARQNLAHAAWQIRSRVRANLAAYELARESAELLKQQGNDLQSNAQLLSERAGQAEASSLNASEARLLADKNRLALQDAQQQIVQSYAALAEAMGVPVQALNEVRLSSASLNLPTPALPFLSEARRSALLGRSDLLALLASYAASEAALQLEVARQYPDVHLGPGFTYDQGQNKWGFGITIPVPILNQNRGPIAEAEAHRQEAAAQVLALQDTIIHDVDDALSVYQAACQKVEVANRIRTERERQNRLIREVLRPSDTSRLTLFRAQVDLEDALLGQVEARRQAQQALGALEDALEQPLTGTRHIPPDVIERGGEADHA